jgi:hypothetical protein
MRLTLRTLLAWLDDTLPATQVRDIGKQVAESPFAQELVDRIHRVTRQRRFTVPPKSGPEATDPNVVAGYVDNDLEPEQVAEYEKKCLTSDVNLAEAASVHQILSLLGQKVVVPPEAKARMYQLVKGRETVSPHRIDGAKPRPPEPVTRPIQPWVAPEPPRRHWLERIAPVALCLGLIALLSWSAYESLTPSKIDGSAPAGLPANGAINRTGDNQQAAATGTTATEADTSSHTARTADASSGPEHAALEATAHKTEPNPPGDGAQGSLAVAGTNAGKTETAAGKPKTEPAVKPPTREVPTGSLGVVEKADGVLLRFSNDKREWERIGDGTALGSSDLLLCLAPFQARIIIGKIPVTLIGETMIRLTSKNATDDPAIDLQSGRAQIENPTAPAKLKIEFAGRTVDIQRASPGVLAVERLSQWRYAQPATQPPALAIHAPDGEQKVALEQAKETLVGPGTIVADVGGKLTARTEKTVPKWLTETELSLKDQKIGEQFLKQFSAGAPVLADIVVATENDSPVTKKLAIYAVKAMGDLSLLTPILSRANDSGARQSTIVGLRDYLAQGPQAQRKLREQLQEEFGDKTGQIIEKLLVGVTKEEAAKSEALVDLLSPRNTSLAVRELALDNLRILTGRDDLSYDPEHPDERGYNAWKSSLKEGDAKPAPKRKTAR